MKYLIRLIISFLSISLMSISCNNNLTENIFHNVAQESYKYNSVYEAIGIVYTPLRSLFSGYHSYYMANETSSDELVMPANLAGGWNDGGIYIQMHLHTWTSETPQLNNMWDNFYKGALEANNILQLLNENKVPIPNGFTKENFISEVRVARAFYYWLIIDNFGDAPLVTSTSIDSLPSKTSRKVLYDFIVKEITEALPNLSEENSQLTYGRFNKWAAEALLANVYLNAEVYTGQAEWDKCITACSDIIASTKYSLDPNYRDIFETDNEHSPGIIFAIPYDENQVPGFNLEMYAWSAPLKAKRDLSVTPYGTGSARGIPQFIDTYDSNDERLEDTWLIGPQYAIDGTPIYGVFTPSGVQLSFVNSLANGLSDAENEGYRMNKFEVAMGARMNLSNDFPFFRYAGVLLMKAECLLRTGKADEAAELVTKVRMRAFKGDPNDAVVTGSQLLGNTKYKYGYVKNYEIADPGNQDPVKYGRMLDELGWEFAWEAHRRRDDIRFGVFTTKSWLSHRPVEGNRSIFLIPQAAIDANPKLK